MAHLGDDQLAWLKKDLAGLLVEHADRGLRPHPAVDGLRRLGLGHRRCALRRWPCCSRFGSVTVLNGHIHQIIQKVEGNVAFHTARSTAYPAARAGRRARRPGR